LGTRPDREHEITLNRLVISLGIFIYVWLLMPGGADQNIEARLIAGAYLGSAVVLLLHLLIFPAISVTRRLVAMGVDLILLSCGLYAGGEYVTILYPFYYWIILGNGFRYGVKYLYFGIGLAVVGFYAVIRSADYWLANGPLGLGLLGGIVILPLYAATLIRSLSQAREQAEQANQAKTQFLASVSHELRTPLNAVVGMSDLLRETNLRTHQLEMVDTISSSSRALLALIDDLLDFASIEAGKIAIKTATFDLTKVLSEVRTIGSIQASGKDLLFELHVTPQTPHFLVGDERRLREVLLNLVSNAVKFTERGCVLVSVDGVVDEDVTSLYIEVSDTGIGIEEAAREAIFDRFTQADETILNRFGGTGLGLAIAQKLVRLQGGEITVESTPGHGSTFRFKLPFGYQDAPEDARATLSDVEVIILGPATPEVEAARDRLTAECGSVRRAENVLQAIRLLRASESSLIHRKAVLVAGDNVLGPLTDDGSLKLTELKAAGPDGLFLLAPSSSGFPEEATRRAFSAVLRVDTLAEDLNKAMRLARDRSAAPARSSIIKRNGRSLNVLIADDNRVNQKVISLILEAAGHRVVVAEDGEQALDKLESQAFDLVVMDINMPVMDGIEATKLYRMAAINDPYIPILGLTADATPAAARQASEAGMDACLTKPVNGSLLLNQIDELTKDRAGGRPGQRAAVASHPSAEPGDGIDVRLLENLKALGGPAFVRDVLSTFLVDGAALLVDLQYALDQRDVTAFKEKTHALQSGAGNIGAQGLAERCRLWQPGSSDDLALNGPAALEAMRADFDAARARFLREYVSGPVLVFDPRQSDSR
jgi:two-component system sensor histidine kinase RpfC